ncbi:MAG: hypothetical protein HYW91_01575 [Candidatus Sungbacteria bacterium]|nr:hypothetical protein [Candidatus Sungbacteria bacterium]
MVYASSSTTTIPNSIVNVWSIATSTTAAYPALSISTASTTAPALVGIGTTNPSAPLHVDKVNANTANTLAILGNSGASINQNLFIETFGDNASIALQAATNGRAAARSLLLNPSGGPVFIGDDVNANSLGGLTINQGANDDEILTLKSSDVAHGITGGSETDTFAWISKVDNDRGGLNLSGLIETGETRAISIRGFSPTNTTSAGTTARAHVMVHGYDVSGTGATNAAANSLIFGVLTQVSSAEHALFFVDAEGDLFVDGNTTPTAFDEHQDAELIRAYERWRTQSKPDEIILNRWDEYVQYNKEDLEREEIISRISEEDKAKGSNPMISLTQLNRVQTGAAWQIYSKARDTELELTGADMAEWTKVTGSYADYEPGDIIMFSSEDRKVEKSASEKPELLVGVVALNPGPLGFSYVLDMDAVKILDKSVEEIEQEYNARMVTTIGYTPIKVSTENGPLRSGDAITASSMPGVGMKAKPGDRIIGFAFESFDPTQGKMGTHDIDLPTRTYKKFFHPLAKQLPDGKWQGWVFGYVNLGYAKLDATVQTLTDPTNVASNATAAWSVDQQSGKVNVNFFGDLNLNGNSILNVSKILGMDGKWKIDETGKLIVKEIETEKIKSQKGYTVPDEDTGAPFCIKVKSGALVAAQGECGSTQAPTQQPTSLPVEEDSATTTATNTPS